MYLFLRTYQYNIELIFSIKNRITAKTISLFSRNTVSIMDKVYHSVSIAVSAAAFRVQDCCVGAAAFRVQDCCVGAAVSEFKISVSALLSQSSRLLCRRCCLRVQDFCVGAAAFRVPATVVRQVYNNEVSDDDE